MPEKVRAGLAGKEKFTLALSVSLCAFISVLIIIHNFQYSRNFFPDSIAFLFAAVVEIAFVSVSIVGAISGRWNYWDRTLKAALFALSIVPATLESSEKIRGLVFEEWSRQQPSEPPEPAFQKQFALDEIKAVDREIESLRKFKSSYDLKADSRTWYAFQDQKRIDSLLAKREKLAAQVKQIQAEYFSSLKAHQAELERFKAQRDLSQMQSLFNLIFLVWALCLIWVLQTLNARLSGNAALILAREPNRDDENPEPKEYKSEETEAAAAAPENPKTATGK